MRDSRERYEMKIFTVILLNNLCLGEKFVLIDENSILLLFYMIFTIQKKDLIELAF